MSRILDLTGEERNLLMRFVDDAWSELDEERGGAESGSKEEGALLFRQQQLEELSAKLRRVDTPETGRELVVMPDPRKLAVGVESLLESGERLSDAVVLLGESIEEIRSAYERTDIG